MTSSQKFATQKILVITALFIVTGFLLPWWLMPAVAFTYGCVVGLNEKSARHFFAQVFAGVFLAWALTAFAFDVRSSFQLSTRLGGMFKLGFPMGGIVISAFIGALLGALFALVGASVRIGTVRVVDDRPETLR